jgi:FdhE protein
MDDTRRRWLEANPFLAPLAHFLTLVEGAADAGPYPEVPLSLEGFAADHAAGVPLLRSAGPGRALREAAAGPLGAAAVRLPDLSLPAKLVDGCRELRDALAIPAARGAAVDWLVANEPEANPPAQAGLLRFVGWQVLGRVLAPHAETWRAFRQVDTWRRPTCPTCGALPGMAQLVDHAAGRERQLACGCCATRWTWKRLGCPFCGCEASDRLAVLELEGPAGLRLDVCESCKGYVKTCAGAGDQTFFLADWPTLVLDAMAAERGYVRRGASLYEL